MENKTDNKQKKYDINDAAYKIVRKNMKKLRKKHKLKSKELADKIGISLQHYSRIERGDSAPSLHLLNKLCKEFDVHISYFFSEDDVSIIDSEGNVLIDDLGMDDTINLMAFRNINELSPEAKKKVSEFIKFLRFQEFSEGKEE